MTVGELIRALRSQPQGFQVWIDVDPDTTEGRLLCGPKPGRIRDAGEVL